MSAAIRTATLEDVPALETLIADSVMRLQARDYTEQQRAGALGTVFGVDGQLIRDGTYFAIESESRIVACGGWSRRGTLFGSDDSPAKDETLLNAATDAARIRAFFVHPEWARRGLGSQIMRACQQAAQQHGFSRLELVATVTGEPLYAAHGFTVIERFNVALANGAALPVIRMGKLLTPPR